MSEKLPPVVQELTTWGSCAQTQLFFLYCTSPCPGYPNTFTCVHPFGLLQYLRDKTLDHVSIAGLYHFK